MKLFSVNFLDKLTMAAKKNYRQRQHDNIHENYQEVSQRLFNAVEPDSYIQPHRHFTDPKSELLVPIRGTFALIIFNDQGDFQNVFGLKAGGSKDFYASIELSPSFWHTVVSLETGSILLEVKAGPFDENNPKDLADWAPKEGSQFVNSYQKNLKKCIKDTFKAFGLP